MVPARVRGEFRIEFQLAIHPLNGDKVTGTWTMQNGDCQGDYPFAGTFKGNRLRIKTEPGSRHGCGPYTGSFELKGEKMVGRYSGQDITLEK